MNIYDDKVEDLFGLRTSNALRRNNCHTIRDLLTLGRGKVSLINGIGEGAMEAISYALAARGLSWSVDSCAPPQASRPALARQGWAPVGTGPSIEDLGPLIVWLTDMAIEAADAGRSDEAGMLTWASLVLGERVDEDAPDHGADSSSSLSREIWDLISESDGVYGLHQNGDLAPWDELLPGGEYERLLSLPPFDDTASDHVANVSNMV